MRILTVAICLLAAAAVFAQAGGDPWTRAVQVLQQDGGLKPPLPQRNQNKGRWRRKAASTTAKPEQGKMAAQAEQGKMAA